MNYNIEQITMTNSIEYKVTIYSDSNFVKYFDTPMEAMIYISRKLNFDTNSTYSIQKGTGYEGNGRW